MEAEVRTLALFLHQALHGLESLLALASAAGHEVELSPILAAVTLAHFCVLRCFWPPSYPLPHFIRQCTSHGSLVL